MRGITCAAAIAFLWCAGCGDERSPATAPAPTATLAGSGGAATPPAKAAGSGAPGASESAKGPRMRVPLTSVSLSPDGRFLAAYCTGVASCSGAESGLPSPGDSVYVWELPGGRLLGSIESEGIVYGIQAVKWSSNGSILAVASQTLRAFKLPELKLQVEATDPRDADDFGMSADASRMVWTFGQGAALFDLTARKQIVERAVESTPDARSAEYKSSAAISRQGSRVIVAAAGRPPELWDGGTGTLLARVDVALSPKDDSPDAGTAGEPERMTVGFSPDGATVVISTTSGRVAVADATTGTGAALRPGSRDDAVNAWTLPVDVSADSKLVAIFARRGEIEVYDIGSRARKGSWSGDGDTQVWNGHIAFSPDAKYVAAWVHGVVRVIAVDQKEEPAGARFEGNAVGWSPQGVLYVLTPQGDLLAWSPRPGQSFRLPLGAATTGASLSPDGRLLALARKDVLFLRPGDASALGLRLFENGKRHESAPHAISLLPGASLSEAEAAAALAGKGP